MNNRLSGSGIGRASGGEGTSSWRSSHLAKRSTPSAGLEVLIHGCSQMLMTTPAPAGSRSTRAHCAHRPRSLMRIGHQEAIAEPRQNLGGQRARVGPSMLFLVCSQQR